ncbi:bifunctional adenosylcobinamide kinase/adenosylcobinamide-phosphate guanylyltransferase [Paenibacillus tarimensis]|uniref:bifunctional adenosylcobinamide kinase/adenosylcobinamide-phosphate guanylyltransferase n=1 Tax=Paenibacillus tarimensis TaxID=416012 RepID=UPI001F36F7DE|nr:bifunctional adenosylcobinamide kinase/adenosylcobinamide-phosphate guanylyltransferase [Paenibacillus tarimensis]MCF2944799.1 bifunctional adenosylcobinamide kinase/adenosylcobinamide-phosphate guanylyltransferase [Paenibacillus tarimensis]
MAYLVTGGARSGKSGFAEELASRLGSRGIYVATSQPYDGEMEERVALHRAARTESGFSWETVEEPLRLADLLLQLNDSLAAEGEAPVILVDCLTLWLTNQMLLFEEADEELSRRERDERLYAKVEELADAAAAVQCPLILVTNEVGSGIVPDYPLGRRFRDHAGRLNRRIAELSERVFLVTAGIPVDLKALAFRWEEL